MDEGYEGTGRRRRDGPGVIYRVDVSFSSTSCQFPVQKWDEKREAFIHVLIRSLTYVDIVSWTNQRQQSLATFSTYTSLIILHTSLSRPCPLSSATMRPPLLVFALLGPLPTSAFYPTKFRANLSMIPGISHEQMTEEVLTSAATSFFPSVAESLNGTLGASLSQGMLEARTVIVRSNAWVDWGYHMPYWHFDGDSDLESVETLEGARAALVKHMIEGDVSAARTNLGQALHLVQDYYAYRSVRIHRYPKV